MYKLIVDYGKPYEEEEVKNFIELEHKIRELQELFNTEDFAYLDVIILKDNIDITDKIFNILEKPILLETIKK